MSATTEYEKNRLANINRNKEILRQLGLESSDSKTIPKVKQEKVVKSNRSSPIRRSRRLQGESAVEHVRPSKRIQNQPKDSTIEQKPTAPKRNRIQIPKKQKDGDFQHTRHIIFTGRLAMGSRTSASSLAVQNGYSVSNTITTTCNNNCTLVVGDNYGSKLERAKNLGLRIIAENPWLKSLKYGN
jgi:NAD-dependent DNA ligase